MKKICLVVAACCFSLPVWADTNLEALLNKVSLQLQAEQWVTTTTALVDVSVSASVTGQGIEKLQNDIMQQLKQLSAKGEWHMVSFNRSQDQSGLENIQMTAEARLPQTELAHLRDTAKSISKPGEKFDITNIAFTPSEDEMRSANNNLRANIYQQAKAEIDVLNKAFPNQKYYLHQMNFLFTPPEQPMPMAMNMMARAARPPAPPLMIGNKLRLQANVVIASMPEMLMQKIPTQ